MLFFAKLITDQGIMEVMIQIDILCIGSLERDEEGNVLSAHSTSTLIRAPGHNIVVDPSTRYMKPAVKTSFKQIGVFPKEVDMVVLTHTHSDHRENLDMYPNARVYVHKGGKSEIPGAKIIDQDEYKLTDGVKLVYTPGHCTEEMSVFVDSDVHYVIAGDAIPLEGNFRKDEPPTLSTDRRLALESIKKIREYADVVIPGHGFPFMTDR